MDRRANVPTECLKLTKAMQKTCETLQNVADLYDDHVSQSSWLFRSELLLMVDLADRLGEHSWLHMKP